MIEPVRFGYNPDTAVNNIFQQDTGFDVQQSALLEFSALVNLLRGNGVSVTVVQDTPEPHTPDSLFPNNWLSFHEGGLAVLYPMFAFNRRQERKHKVLQAIDLHFQLNELYDLSPYESEGQFLEGTGSLVLDRLNRIAYACISPRTSASLLYRFCELIRYRAIPFTALGPDGQAIYHTNVMMSVADEYAVICLEAIPLDEEKQELIEVLQGSGKAIIPISPGQLARFAGNMLQVVNKQGEKLLVMSSQAYESLMPWQIAALEKFNRILHSPLDTIEKTGGGSARCMMAEVFLEEVKREKVSSFAKATEDK
ncbi:MAG: amidinotransferase [Chitinophagaceae bacterium]|nr:amidinotransferase [Chitinophagaceae bacterium]